MLTPIAAVPKKHILLWGAAICPQWNLYCSVSLKSWVYAAWCTSPSIKVCHRSWHPIFSSSVLVSLELVASSARLMIKGRWWSTKSSMMWSVFLIISRLSLAVSPSRQVAPNPLFRMQCLQRQRSISHKFNWVKLATIRWQAYHSVTCLAGDPVANEADELFHLHILKRFISTYFSAAFQGLLSALAWPRPRLG